MGERMCEKMCEKMCEEMCEEMGEKMGEKRCEGKRETTIYGVRSPRQTAENDVKHPEVRRKKMSLHVGILHEDGQTGIAVWERVLAGTSCESALGTDLGSLAGNGGLFGPLVKS
jgi:hypothetical protein